MRSACWRDKPAWAPWPPVPNTEQCRVQFSRPISEPNAAVLINFRSRASRPRLAMRAVFSFTNSVCACACAAAADKHEHTIHINHGMGTQPTNKAAAVLMLCNDFGARASVPQLRVLSVSPIQCVCVVCVWRSWRDHPRHAVLVNIMALVWLEGIFACSTAAAATAAALTESANV